MRWAFVASITMSLQRTDTSPNGTSNSSGPLLEAAALLRPGMMPCWKNSMSSSKTKNKVSSGQRSLQMNGVIKSWCPFGNKAGVTRDCGATESLIESPYDLTPKRRQPHIKTSYPHTFTAKHTNIYYVINTTTWTNFAFLARICCV